MRLSVAIVTAARPERLELGRSTDIWHFHRVFRKAGGAHNTMQ
jgi:hypothetical protein